MNLVYFWAKNTLILTKNLLPNSEINVNKLALLWGEAQKKIAYSYLKVT